MSESVSAGRDNPDDAEAFVQELTASQGELRAFILAGVADYGSAEEILQRTNLTLWKKANQYELGTNFVAWAVTVARFETLRFCRDRRRDRHVFDPDVAEMLLSTVENEPLTLANRRDALRECLAKLPDEHRSIIWLRYSDGLSVKQLSEETNRSLDAIKSLLLRIRRALENCVRINEKNDQHTRHSI